MKKTIKTTMKGLLLAGVAALAVNSVQAQPQSLGGVYTTGDLLAGFSSSTPSSANGSDLIINLGLESSLANGQFWDITSLLAADSATVPANLTTLANTGFGVVGVTTGPGTVYETSAGTPPHIANQSAYNTVSTSMGGLGGLISSSGFGTPSSTATGTGSWYGDTAGGGSGTFKANDTNPNGQPGVATLNFFKTIDNNTAPSILNTFNLSQNGGGDLILTYGTAVPEPATYGMLFGVGLLLLGIRRMFVRTS
jgi:hypothetical protein